MPNQRAIADFQTARDHYLARRFAEARHSMQRYRQAVDYALFEQTDRRPSSQPQITIVIVSYQTNLALLHCLQSVYEQQGPAFEIILVDNGGNESIHTELSEQALLWIKLPINLLPSEGRNIGSHFARSDLVVFLDDDALMAPGYLAAAHLAMVDKTFLGLRGRIQPKTSNAAAQPPHYDLGDTLKPAEFNLEGNMVIRRQLLKMLGGFDPLIFGHEGKALSQQRHLRFPGKDIQYCPDLIIRHDWAAAENLANKRERQALGRDYLNYLKEHPLNEGLTIILREGDKLAEAKNFLEGLANHNSYKPIEVLILAKDSQQAVGLIRPYMAEFFARVLPASAQTFSRVAQASRYDNCVIVDLPTQISADVLSGWLQSKRADLKTALLCTKAELEKLGETQLSIALKQLANNMGKTLSNKTAAYVAAQLKAQPVKPAEPRQEEALQPMKAKAKPPTGEKPKLSPEVGSKIQEIETQLIQKEAQLSETYHLIAEKEVQFLSIKNNNQEKQALKDQIKTDVLKSCQLLSEIKISHSILQELQIQAA